MSGIVTRDGHSATFEVIDDRVRITSKFGALASELGGRPARSVASALLFLQIARAARKSATPNKEAAARRLHDEWQTKWRSRAPARWTNRPPPVEVVEAVASGWFPSRGRMIDLGCGTGEIAAWFAERGYQATGVDIAQAAIDAAAAKHAELSSAGGPGSLEFTSVDLCSEALPGRTFDILVDRGCMHQIPQGLLPDFARNIHAIAAPHAKMLVLSKAFRGRAPFGDANETTYRTEQLRQLFAGMFELERAVPTYLNPDNSADPLPGMAFWLSRTT